jgi:hypothetical protein
MNVAAFNFVEMTFLTRATTTLLLIVAIIIIAIVSLYNPIRAESGDGNDVFKVIVTLFGITNSTKDVLTLVSVDDQTKVKLFNAEDPENSGQDKVSYTMTFPGTEVPDEEPYTVCTMTVKDFKMQCDKGNNSPLNRPEFIDVNLGSGGSSEGNDDGEDEEED